MHREWENLGEKELDKRGRVKPTGRPQETHTVASVKELCRAYTTEAVEALVQIMDDDSAQPRARVSAAEALLNRGWGKPVQQVSSEHQETIRILIGDGTQAALGPWAQQPTDDDGRIIDVTPQQDRPTVRIPAPARQKKPDEAEGPQGTDTDTDTADGAAGGTGATSAGIDGAGGQES